MAGHSLFDFLFLLLPCYFLLLLWAWAGIAAAGEDHEECPKPPLFCGNLGEISFPFTTSSNPECGLYISGCGNDSEPKEIQLLNQYGVDYKIVSIWYKSIFIYSKKPWDDGILMRPFKIHNRFDLCTSINNSDYGSSRMSTSNHDYKYLIEIEVDLPRSCEDCYYPRSQCQLDRQNFSCVSAWHEKRRHLKAVIIGLSIGLATFITLALLVILFLYKRINKSSGIQNQPRSTYSGPYRSTTNPTSGPVYFGIPVFSYEELQEATNNFDPARELGEGGFGTVYHGKLRDGREVAVKRLFERNYRPVESFNTEIQILTRMRHTNLVSLYGCTSRHSRELLLVYEYIPNGTLSCHLHGDRGKHGLLPWPVRMKIAIETAGALTCLHASDIIHRDVKSSNILLDNNFSVKVADFGLSRLFPADATHVSTAPRGTPGYVDPDYRICYQLTNKSDVYSFGVVLVELISSLPAVDMTRDRDEIKLANLAIRKIQRKAFCELIDPSLGFQSDDKLKRMIISVAELAFQCLQGDKEFRPSMGEVLEVLQRIESGKDEPGNLERIDVHGARISQSYAHPPPPNTMMKQQRHHQTF